MIRNIYGRTGLEYGVNPSGPFANTSYATNNQVLNAGSYQSLVFDASTAVPTGNANKPRAWGALPCVYLGAPR